MKSLVVLSGKGGTGKTTVVAALAHLATDAGEAGVVLVDADPDAANLALLLDAREEDAHDFEGGAVAVIEQAACGECGACWKQCRFDAVTRVGRTFRVDPLACEGCGACTHVCPDDAIHMEPRVTGRWYRSRTPYGTLVHAELFPAGENSGKLVSRVRAEAEAVARAESARLLLVDGPPGIGCPAIAAAARADRVLIVTEPTGAGLHDLERAVAMTRHFGVPAAVCLNRADLHEAGARAVERWCAVNGVELAGSVPYDDAVPGALARGVPVNRAVPEGPAAAALRRLWDRLCADLQDET